MSADTRTPMNTRTLTNADFEAATDKAGLAAGVICSSFKVFMADQGIEWSDEFVKPAATALINMVVRAELAAKVEELAELRAKLSGDDVPSGIASELAHAEATIAAKTAQAEGLRAALLASYEHEEACKALYAHQETEPGDTNAAIWWHEQLDELGAKIDPAYERFAKLRDEALSASPSPWRDVATHDKSRRAVLVWCPRHLNIYEVCWRDDEYLGDPGWFHFSGQGDRLRENPTHWMPLPPAPPTPQQSNRI